jgi:transposase
MRPKGTAEELERRRLLAVRRVEEGYSQEEVARFLGVNPRSVRRWLRLYRQIGEGALAPIPHHGRAPKLLPSQEAAVLRWVTQSPRDFGFRTELWTAPRIAKLIERDWGIHFHPRYLNHWLTQRGVRPQMPVTQARERDQQAIDRWLSHDWPAIQERAQTRRAHIVLIDEAGLLLAPLLRRSQAPRGHPMILKQRGRHRDKVSLIAALTLSPLRGRLGLYFRSYPLGYVTKVEAADFLRELLRHLHGEVIVLWDGGTSHKGEPIRDLLKQHPRLSLERLPAYAPDLNPVEMLWEHLKYAELVNFAAQDARQLDKEAHEVLDQVRQDSQRLRSFWNHCELPLAS